MSFNKEEIKLFKDEEIDDTPVLSASNYYLIFEWMYQIPELEDWNNLRAFALIYSLIQGSGGTFSDIDFLIRVTRLKPEEAQKALDDLVLKGILSKTYDLKTKKPKYGINWFKVDSYFPELEEQEKGGDEIEK